jgi:chemosensory pili system protein ChpA (sensor histidine kinase/response regulator)
MATNHDYIALDWVRGEIEQTLTLAQKSLESFARDRSEATQANFCLNHIHQVHGTLQMIEFYGAALLAEEMENLCLAVIEKRSTNEDEALDVLMGALLQLDSYLEHVQGGQQDLPVVLLPILNDLRACQGQNLLSDTSMFSPALQAAYIAPNPQHSKRMEDPKVVANLRKLRQMFQVSLAGIVRNQNTHDHLIHLHKVLSRLEKFCQGSPIGKLWTVALAFIEVLQSEEQIGSAMKHLLRELDKQLKGMIGSADSALVSPVAEDVLKNLLYYIAKSTADTDRIRAVKEAFKLADSLPDTRTLDAERAKMMGPDKATLSSIAQVLVEELNQVKDQIDIYGRDESATDDALQSIEPNLQQIANTLAVLGLGSARKGILDLISDIVAAKTDGLSEQQLMNAADIILLVEGQLAYLHEDGAATIADHGLPAEQIQAAHGALISESKLALERAKNSIVSFITSNWDHSHIDEVPNILDSIRGGLQMIPLTEAAALLNACSAFVKERLLVGKKVPDWAQLDRLADTISSLEYYLDRVAEGASDNERILAIARESLEKLGCLDSAGGRPVLSEHHTVEAAIEAPETHIKSTDEGLLDDEILSIFIEEANEVRDEIGEAINALQEVPENKHSASDLRRAFHTLKGSGRLVAASDIASIAWLMEDRLNKALDAGREISADELEVARVVYGALPEMLQAFSRNDASEHRGALEALIFGLDKDLGSDVITAENDQKTVSDTANKSMLAPASEAVVNDDLIDEEILEIFVEEAEEVSETINTYLPSLLDDFENEQALTELRRAFHTLKGSGRMVEAEVIGETAWAIESLLNRVIDDSIIMNESIANLLMQVSNKIPYLIECFQQRVVPDFDRGQIEQQAELILNGEQPLVSSELAPDGLHVNAPKSEQITPSSSSPSGKDTEQEVAFDHALLDIFESEVLGHVQTIEHFAQTVIETESIAVDDTLSRALHTLKGSANTANIVPIAEIAIPLERLVKETRAHQCEVDQSFAMILIDAMGLIKQAIAQLRSAPQQEISGSTACIATISAYHDRMLEQFQARAEKAGDAGPDPQLVSIFLLEGVDILFDAESIIDDWLNNNISDDAFGRLVNEVAVLGRGARVAALTPIVELCEALASAYRAIEDVSAAPSIEAIQLIKHGHDALIDMMDQTAAGLSAELDESLREALITIEPLLATQRPIEAERSDELSVTPEPSAPTSTSEVEPQLEPLSEELDTELIEIFLEEAQDLIQHSAELLHKWEEQSDDFEVLGELQRDLHTLKGGARMAELNAIGDLSHELETLFEKSVDAKNVVAPLVISLCLQCHDALAQMVDQVAQGFNPAALPDLLTAVQASIAGNTFAISSQTSKTTPSDEATQDSVKVLPEHALEGELLTLFLDESRDILFAINDALDIWRDDGKSRYGVVELQREFHTLKGGARLADLDSVADIAEAAESALGDYLVHGPHNGSVLQDLVAQAHAKLLSMLDHVHEGSGLSRESELISAFREVSYHEEKTEDPILSEIAPSDMSTDSPRVALESQLSDDADAEVLQMFTEEAAELSEAMEENISLWASDPTNQQFNGELQRILHTLKGGARLVSMDALADVSHDLETRLIKAQNDSEAFTDGLKTEVVGAQDQLVKLVEQLKSLESHTSAEQVTEPSADHQTQSTATTKTGQPVEKIQAQAQPSELSVVEKIVRAASESASSNEETKARAVETNVKKPSAKRKPQNKAVVSSQESIRVSAGLLDSLVNLAGETSISRGRLEQQISDFGFTLEEMTSTIERLREQLRRMEMETEAQVIYRAEQEGFSVSEYEEFDPLEMDRYSSIQQLSRALTESTTDLLELRDTLSNRARDAETLLLQQSRINSTLQEGLMKTRMIPFSSIVPRLRRIVRQISSELDKQVDFDVTNAEGEMDRSILERLIAPVEHMLRNALDHGIESAGQRKKAGKAEVGRIELSLSREGGDIVLRMKDDGSGIDSKRILEKAFKQGLLAIGSEPSQNEILQCILQPGFSTAAKVTQISGRGVGLDVVASEIKQMGGVIGIDSNVGQGTEFTVRLPFTVSVNRALMVSTGEDFYAIPLNTIEGIVRISPYELEEYYKPDAPLYEYAGRQYNLQYLGKLLHSSHQPKLTGQPLPLPVILVRGADQPMALQVDHLLGSREIVVKSLGPQFSAVHGVSGGTILGDGSVVVILDLPALIRDENAGILNQVEMQDERDMSSETPLVMVVDDSVTVRKVTTRLLERNGMDVVTAKDGVDAIAQLQDCEPDVMLLDIEMPRMDGFEVATLVRHDPRLKDVPIIMITSRTGQKHRERAFSIGVNEYLGKPFQEQELLATIEQVSGEKALVADS